MFASVPHELFAFAAVNRLRVNNFPVANIAIGSNSRPLLICFITQSFCYTFALLENLVCAVVSSSGPRFTRFSKHSGFNVTSTRQSKSV